MDRSCSLPMPTLLSLDGGRWKNRLDEVRDAREGVALPHGVTWVKEKDIDRDKEFDAFISFSHKDQDLVIPELIEKIEARDLKVKLFIHYKHFLPGELIQLNIMRAIQVSKRTVLVLSKSFLESEWCMFEFRVAHIEALKNHLNRIIIIKWMTFPRTQIYPKKFKCIFRAPATSRGGRIFLGHPTLHPSQILALSRIT
ncbi:protein toll [Caerostris extrusa]|uniref:Protein toll n=1 Tax=Caerostris extrusa TaxID=172846 RepID=A0AAV4NUE1_CAEEX|nr:protein toll [Caerostris extrusa]